MSEQVFKVGDIYNGNKIQEGNCPCCGSLGLDYGILEPNDGTQIFYPWTCWNCGSEGSEYYNLVFSGHNIKIPEKIVKDSKSDIGDAVSELLTKIGMDKPANYDEMVEFIFNDVKETASDEWTSEDIIIAFRRFIEKK